MALCGEVQCSDIENIDAHGEKAHARYLPFFLCDKLGWHGIS